MALLTGCTYFYFALLICFLLPAPHDNEAQVSSDSAVSLVPTAAPGK